MASTLEQLPTTDAAAGRSLPRPMLVFLVSLGFGGAAFVLPDLFFQIVAGLVALILGTSAVWLKIMAHRLHLADLEAAGWSQALLEADLTASLLTGPEGDILYANPAAQRLFSEKSADKGLLLGPSHLFHSKTARRDALMNLLQTYLQDPQPVIERLIAQAYEDGAARETIVPNADIPSENQPAPTDTPSAGPIRVSVTKDATQRLVWRFEYVSELPASGDIQAVMALVELAPDETITSMNPVAEALFEPEASTLAELFATLPVKSGLLNTIKTRDGPREALVVHFTDERGQNQLSVFPRDGCRDLTPGDWDFFDHLPVPLLKLSRDGTILLSNPPARELLLQPSLNGRSLSEVVEGLGRSMRDWLEDAAAARGGLHSEFLRIKRADREVFVQVTLNRAVEEQGPVLIAVLNDATAHKSLEAQFVQSQKMQAIGQLAGGVAHDFNNLLTAITGHCDLLLLRHDQGDQDYADLIQINQNTNRAAALVSQLLAYSRKQTLRPEMMDLRDMLSDLTHLLNRLVGEKVTLSLRHDPMLWSIRADKRQLEQVLMNLVVNARDAMRARGGDIRIETENIELTEPLSRDRAVLAPGRYVKVCVADEGHGIPPDKIQKVFEPFYTTKRTGEGTGLGLSTAYGIVKQTGGFIFVDSELGKGTTFRMYFPAHETVALKRPVAAPVPVLSAPSDGAVLLVEDEAPVRAFATRALQLKGMTVYEADSAEAALELLDDADLRVDVFVSDVVMPGIDGPSWVIEALEKRPQTRVVFISGYAEEAFGEIQSRIPNSVFLPKPFSLTELTEIVQRQLALAQPADEVPAQ
ncbi:MAG: ATP-binding protein [Pseudomonadota bacterium]